jgi:hypothetical protein
MTTLVPVLGDQLSLDLSSLRAAVPGDAIVLMMEVADETKPIRTGTLSQVHGRSDVVTDLGMSQMLLAWDREISRPTTRRTASASMSLTPSFIAQPLFSLSPSNPCLAHKP